MNVCLIKNQYDNVMRSIDLNKESYSQILKSIKNPMIVENKDIIPQWKFCTIKGEQRCTENMGTTNMLILDFDDAGYSYEEFEYNFREYSYIIHTSYSYDGTNSKFRVILPIDKEYEIERLFFKNNDNQSFSPYHLLLKHFEHVDPASFVKAQFFKVPAKRSESAPYYYNIHKGETFKMENIKCFINAYNNCIEQAEKSKYDKQTIWELRKAGYGSDLTKAIEFVKNKMEEAEAGQRHNIIFSLAAWFSKCGGDYLTFSKIKPTWADKQYDKQIDRLEKEWYKIGR